MDATDYMKPQTRVYQKIATTATTKSKVHAPCVVGPSYFLARYSNADEKKELTPVTYTGAGTVLDYQGLNSTYTVDTDFVKLYCEKAFVTLDTPGTWSKYNNNDNQFIYKVGTTATDITNIYGRSVRIGDVFVNGSGTMRSVVSLTQQTQAAKVTPSRTSAVFEASTASQAANITIAKTVGEGSGQEKDGYPKVQTIADMTKFKEAMALYGIVEDSFIVKCTSYKYVENDGTYWTFEVTSASGKYKATVSTSGSTGIPDGFFSGGSSVEIVPGISVQFNDYDTGTTKGYAVLQGDTFVTNEISAGYTDIEIAPQGKYEEASNDTLIFEVVDATNRIVRVYSATGNTDIDVTVKLPSSAMMFAVTSTLSLEVTDGALLVKGDKYLIDCKAASLYGPTCIVKLNGNMTDIAGLTYGYLLTSQITLDSTIETVSETNVTIDNPITITVGARTSNKVCTLLSGYGNLYLDYRAIKPVSANSSVVRLTSTDDIESSLGKIDFDNDIAFGAYLEMLGGSEVYAAVAGGTSSSDYSLALKKLEREKRAYEIVPMTSDIVIGRLVQAHVNKMSQPAIKKFRRMYFGVKNPGEYKNADHYPKSSQSSDDELFCSISGNTLLLKTATSDFASAIDLDIQEGDVIKLIDGNETTVTVVTVSDSPANLITIDKSMNVASVQCVAYKPDTGKAQAQYVAQISSSFNDRRVACVWCDGAETIIDGNYVTQKPWYIAAEMAGLRAANVPQQGLTRTDVSSVSRCIDMYTKYTDEELNIAAAAGTWIITQDNENTTPYIRHQLTTDMDNGIIRREDSMGVNMDYICFDVDDVVDPYIGKRNVNYSTLKEMQKRVRDVLTGLTYYDENTSSIGPQITELVDNSVKISLQDGSETRIKVSFKALIPDPINNVDIEANFDILYDLTIE